MSDWLPDGMRDVGNGLVTALAGGAIGRALQVARQVQMGRRRAMSLSMLWEVPTALGMGLIGSGVAEYLQLDGKAALSAVIVVSYLGPRAIEDLVAWAKRKGKP